MDIRSSLITVTIALYSLSLIFALPEVLAESLKAGIAKVDLTPPMELKAPLGGYEASVSFYGETLGQSIVEGAARGASRLE